MEIQSFIDSPIFQETATKFRNKAHEEAKQAFEDFIELQNEQPKVAASDVPENTFVDNGVKSTILISQLASHERSTATVTNISHTDGLPDGLHFTNAGGMTSKAHTTPTMTAQGLVYETVEDERHEYIAYYDTNSPEDSPVMYVVNQDKMSGKNEYLRIEVNKINPSNASYEEMIALVGYVFRDDPQNAFEASEALVHARDYMEMEGLSPDGNINYSQWLQEVVRRNINYSNPSNQVMGKAAQSLLEYLKDYPRGIDKA